MKKSSGWIFTGENGEFTIREPQRTSYLYFPLANEAGMMSSVTPTLHGDIKTDHRRFLMEPVSVENLHNSRAPRNFWFHIEGAGPWSAAGNSPKQIADRFEDEPQETVTVDCGFLWHRMTRVNRKIGIAAEVTNFVPAGPEKTEIMRVTVSNTGTKPLAVSPVAAIPMYGRSADNLRDHRHVTSLLNRVRVTEYGIELKPSMSFDERGHHVNHTVYGVYGVEEDGTAPVGFCPVLEEFTGEGGSQEWPEYLVRNDRQTIRVGTELEGYETIGAIRFRDIVLQPAESKTYNLAVEIREENEPGCGCRAYLSKESLDRRFRENIEFWKLKTDALVFGSSDRQFDLWMKWVALQPVLRRIYGCSFMPHHDYGRGGRGWRDLWQDCLALLIMEPENVRSLLLNNFAGVRFDGSNATIIGDKPGEFIADRNDISRVWMDHGAWPYLTTRLYIDQTGDLDFLFEEQAYFKDRQINRSGGIDSDWSPACGNRLRTRSGEIYTGTVLEHLLVENLVQFFNVGEHNNIRLEGADWNDALDMAGDRGESVAFSALYCSNLFEMAQLLMQLRDKRGIRHITAAGELMLLLDSVSGEADYGSVGYKRKRMKQFFQTCAHDINGEKKDIDLETVIRDLNNKSEWMKNHIRRNEWIRNKEGFEWFNGYYDNKGKPVEGDFDSGVRMTLTGQVFTIMSGVAEDEQVVKISEAAKRYLRDDKIGGYRLNTNFNEVKLDMGRLFGFAFGHKENGAMFSHMAVMYSNALYKRGRVSDGYDVLRSVYELCTDFDNARIYPGIPEYINEKRRGMYHYLTGSASWLLLTVLMEIYGVKGRLGDLVLKPQLLKEQFDGNGQASVTTLFAGRKLKIVYQNSRGAEVGAYRIEAVEIDGSGISYAFRDGGAVIPREVVTSLDKDSIHTILVRI